MAESHRGDTPVLTRLFPAAARPRAPRLAPVRAVRAGLRLERRPGRQEPRLVPARQVAVSEPGALCEASRFQAEPVEGRRVSKVVKTTLVRGERMEKHLGDPRVAPDLPSAKDDFEQVQQPTSPSRVCVCVKGKACPCVLLACPSGTERPSEEPDRGPCSEGSSASGSSTTSGFSQPMRGG